MTQGQKGNPRIAWSGNMQVDLNQVEDAFKRFIDVADGDLRIAAVLTLAWATIRSKPD